MKEISAEAGVFRTYTNHSVRATAITLWANPGLTDREISGHHKCSELGRNKLSSLMKEISAEAGVFRTYTNHSVRATAITLWANPGLTDREISGHHKCSELGKRFVIGSPVLLIGILKFVLSLKNFETCYSIS